MESSGCRAGMRASKSTYLNSNPIALSVPRIFTPAVAAQRVNHVLELLPRQGYFRSLFDATVDCLGEATDGLTPAERLFDPLSVRL